MTTAIVGRAALAAVAADIGLDALLDELIRRLGDAVRAPVPVETRDRDGFHYHEPGPGLVEWMPAHDPGRRVAIKTVGYHPGNPFTVGLPSVLATVSVYDCTTGALVGVVEGTALTALRTGAASALVSDLLAPDRPLTVAVVGCGAQAVTQLHALSRVRTVERVLAYDTVRPVAKGLADRIEPHVAAPVTVVEERAHGRLLEEADVLVTATSVPIGDGPVIADGDHRRDLHVNAIGADFAGKTELPASLLGRAFVVPDVRSQCVLEGECQQLESHQIGPDLRDLLVDADRHGDQRDQLTVFDSTGWALEDLVAAELVLDLAIEHGAAEMSDLQPAFADPFDPYEDLR